MTDFFGDAQNTVRHSLSYEPFFAQVNNGERTRQPWGIDYEGLYSNAYFSKGDAKTVPLFEYPPRKYVVREKSERDRRRADV